MRTIKDKKYVNRWINTGEIGKDGKEIIIKFENQMAQVEERFIHLLMHEDFQVIDDGAMKQDGEKLVAPKVKAPVVEPKVEAPVEEKPIDSGEEKVDNNITTEDPVVK